MFFSLISAKGQNIFGYDPYDTLKVFVGNFNKEICRNHDFIKKTVFSGDSLFNAKLKTTKSRSSLIAYKKDKINLKTSTKGNKFEIEVFEMNFKGEINLKTGDITEFIAKSKGMKYKVLNVNGTYELIPIKFKEKTGNENQVIELKKNLPTLLSFVKGFIVLPKESCK